MSRTIDPLKTSADGPQDAAGAYVCPFCGLSEETASAPERSEGSPCPRCGMSDTPSTRKATKARIGPWHVRQVRNPWAPGMKWDTLISLVRRGQVTANSIVRGPTTHQLWKRAAHVKGLSREFLVCYSCGESIENTASLCPHCNRLQEPPANPDVLLEGRDGRDSRNAQPAPPAPTAPEAAPPPTLSAVPLSASQLETTPTPASLPEPGSLSEHAPAPRRELAGLDRDPEHGNGSGRASRPLEKLLGASERPLNLPERPATLDEGFRAPAAMETSLPPVHRGVTPPDNRPADALLTAEELATAFQLNFNPKGKGRPRTPGRGMKIVLVMVMLALSIGCLLYVRPELREKSMRWARQQMDSLRSRSSTIEPQFEPSAPAATPSGAATTQKSRPALAPAPAAPAPRNQPLTATPISSAPPPLMQATPVKVQPNPAPAPAASTAPVVKAVVKPTTSPAPIAMLAQPQPAALVEKPKAREGIAVVPPAAAPARAPEPKTEPKVESKPAAPPAPAPAPAATPAVDPVDQARMLWRNAIDAERDGKFREAVKCYEQIKKLPADVQPEGLDVRLDQAKKQVK